MSNWVIYQKQSQFKANFIASLPLEKTDSNPISEAKNAAEKFSKKLQKIVNGIDRYLALLYTENHGKSIF
jgi:hypothetical protein